MRNDDPSGDGLEKSNGHRAPITLSPEEARQGEIILRSRTRRWLFVGSLAAVVVIALLALALRPL